MLAKAKYLLHVGCISFIGLATAVQGIQLDEVSQDTASKESHCLGATVWSLPSGTVQYVKGQATTSTGEQLKVRSRVSAVETVTVDANSFLSLSLSDGTVLNIQPDSVTSIDCELNAPSIADFAISKPYLTGAIRG